MEKLNLDEKDIFEINKIEGVDNKKSFIQRLMVDRLFKRMDSGVFPNRVICNAFTRFGKSYMASNAINRFKAKNPDKKNYCIVPSLHLKKEWVNTGLFDNVYVINSFTMKGIELPDNVGMVIIDEVHHACNESSNFFSTLFDKLPLDCKVLALSASIKLSHLNFMAKKGFQRYFKLSLKDGLSLGIVPDYDIINVPCELNRTEKRQYITLCNDIDKIISKFYHISNDKIELERLMYCILAPDKERRWFRQKQYTSEEICEYVIEVLSSKNIKVNSAGSIISAAKTVDAMIYKRKILLQSIESKQTVAFQLIKQLSTISENEKVLVFMMQTEKADRLRNSLNRFELPSESFHSKISKKDLEITLDRFYAGEINNLISIGKLKEGFTVKDCKYALRVAYTGTEIDAQQITGRVLTFDENNLNKKSYVINLFAEGFEFNSIDYSSIETELLEHAYKGETMTWLTSVDDAIEFIKKGGNQDDDESL